MELREVTLVGFGSQGQSWANNLRDSGWNVKVAHESPQTSGSMAAARSQGFETRSLEEISRPSPALICFLCPDEEIPRLYGRYFQTFEQPIDFVLAHGFAVYSEGINPKAHPSHRWSLLAPKAIGPKLRSEFLNHPPRKPHSLKAAFHSTSESVTALAVGLGFSPSHLIKADFRTETVGDLISEQTLLCGGVFTLLEETARQMARAGVPRELIAEECITELELVASLIKQYGPSQAFQKISSVAQAGALDFRKRLLKWGLSGLIEAQADRVISGAFTQELQQGNWKAERAPLLTSLDSIDRDQTMEQNLEVQT